MSDYNAFENINDIKHSVNLQIENEMNKYIENEEEDYEITNDFTLLEGEEPPAFGPNNNNFRSKSCVCNNNISLFNAPNQKIKIFDGHITPLKLSAKTYGGTKWKYKKMNPIILDYQKSTIDSKSCNDNQNSADDVYDDIDSDYDTERTTPNIEDFKNLQNCRKKMAFFGIV